MKKEELIKIILREFGRDHFKGVSTGAGIVSLKRREVNGMSQIIVPYNNYPGAYICGPYLTAWRSFDIIEDCLEKYYTQYNINQPLVTIYRNSRRDDDLSNIKLQTEEDVISFMKRTKHTLFEDVVEFLDKYKTIDLVNSEVESYTTDFAKINGFLFTPQPIRRLILKGLFESSDFEAFGNNLVKAFGERAKSPNSGIIDRYSEFLPDLFNELTSANASPLGRIS